MLRYIREVCNFCETSSTIIMTVFKQVSSPHLLLASKTDSPAPKHKRLVEPMLLCHPSTLNQTKLRLQLSLLRYERAITVSSLYFWLVYLNISSHFCLIIFLPPHCFKLTTVSSNKAPQIKQRGWWVRQAGQVENLRLCSNPLSCERSDPWLWRGFIQTMCRRCCLLWAPCCSFSSLRVCGL